MKQDCIRILILIVPDASCRMSGIRGQHQHRISRFSKEQ